jgi:hypothetical protein
VRVDDKLDYDPPPDKRRYFRHSSTGDLAYLVTRGGKEHIKFDRPFDPTVMPFREAEWKEEPHAEPMAPGQAVQVAFAADKVLCRYLGLPLKAKTEWAGLNDKERSAWIANGPVAPAARQELYAAIRKVLEPYTRPK